MVLVYLTIPVAGGSLVEQISSDPTKADFFRQLEQRPHRSSGPSSALLVRTLCDIISSFHQACPPDTPRGGVMFNPIMPCHVHVKGSLDTRRMWAYWYIHRPYQPAPRRPPCPTYEPRASTWPPTPHVGGGSVHAHELNSCLLPSITRVTRLWPWPDRVCELTHLLAFSLWLYTRAAIASLTPSRDGRPRAPLSTCLRRAFPVSPAGAGRL